MNCNRVSQNTKYSGKCVCFFMLVLCWGIFGPSVADAHRVNIFAYVDGNDVVVESSFPRGKKVRNGLVEVINPADGSLILQGQTDIEGVFRFTIPSEGRFDQGIKVTINAGEGHYNEWLIDRKDLAGAAEGKIPPPNGASADKPVPKDNADITVPKDIAIDAAEIRKIINESLENKLAPIRNILKSEFESGPGLREIVGGIGWIVGIVGIIAYFVGRNRYGHRIPK